MIFLEAKGKLIQLKLVLIGFDFVFNRPTQFSSEHRPMQIDDLRI